MHRLVAEDAGDGLGEVAVAENRNHAKIAARGALLEAGREAQHVRLGLQRLDRELVVGGLFWLCRLTAERRANVECAAGLDYLNEIIREG